MGTAIIPAPNLNVKKTDIVNNLTSTNTDKPLSAAMGKELNSRVTMNGNTFSGDVIVNLKSVPSGVSIYKNSSTTANYPAGMQYGSYTIFKEAVSGLCTVMVVQQSQGKVAFANGINPNTDTSINWIIAQSTAISTLATSISIQTTTDASQFITASQTGNIVCVDVVLRPASALAANTEIGKVTLPRNLKQHAHAACISYQLHSVRFLMTNSGIIKIESAANANDWLSVSLVGILA